MKAPKAAEVRFKKIVTAGAPRGIVLFGLTEDGRVYAWIDGEKVWSPLSMVASEEGEAEGKGVNIFFS